MAVQRKTQSRSGIPSEHQQILRARPAAALALPDPSETWLLADIESPELKAAIWTFSEYAIVENVDIPDHKGNNIWRTNTRAYQYVEEAVEPGPWPRCMHRGMVNHGDGEYGCASELCDEVYTRAEAERALGVS